MPESTLVVPWSDRTLLSLTGADRASFLHNLCTNDIKKLTVGQSCEAFVTNVQGKTIGHVMVACEPDRLLLASVPAQAEPLLAHLDRYLITEDVVLADESKNYQQWLLTGPDSPAILQRVFCVDVAQAISNGNCQGESVVVWRMPFTEHESYAVLTATSELSIAEKLVAAGAELATAAQLEPRRLAHRFPWFGQDVTEANLPQEVDRNEAAISFTKGCYLGQETVARIDALGHVNKLLVGIRSEADLSSDMELFADEKSVGRVTSSAKVESESIGMAYVKREIVEQRASLAQENGAAVELRPRL